jgi:predicted nucleic acid-binding protein
MRLLLDTSVLIDYFAGREPYHADAFRLRMMHEFGDAELWTSVQSFADIAYILRGETDSDTLQDAFRESLSFLHVCSLDEDDLRWAAAEKWEDFEDCLIERCAEKTKAEAILSRDAQGFARARTAVLTPRAFFERLASQQGLTYELM